MTKTHQPETKLSPGHDPRKRFAISADGDDARIIASTDDYDAGRRETIRLSEDPNAWLGMKMMSRKNGRILSAFNGRETGYLDLTNGWTSK